MSGRDVREDRAHAIARALPRGERLYGSAPFGRWHRQTFVAGLTCDALIAPWIIPSAMDGDAFDICVETQLVPVLSPGTVVILDNLSTHRSPRAASNLLQRGCWLLFLPTYRPDLKPIEMAFSKLKAHPQRPEARSFETLGRICHLFTPAECENYFRAAGYAPDSRQSASVWRKEPSGESSRRSKFWMWSEPLS